MQISIIVAQTADGAIGRGGDMLYHISDDLRRFKQLTMGHPVIMGRKTFESLPKGALPGRRNLVITRNRAYTAPGIETYASLDDAITACADVDEAFVIGGGEIYKQAMPLANKLYITQIHTVSGGADTYFPVIDPDLWHVDSHSEPMIDQRSGVTFSYVCLSRK